jgi:signal transduction histidine kinase
MKNIFTLFFVLNLLQHQALAQQNPIDSLLSLLKKDKEDTSKVNHLNALAWELMNFNPDTAILLSTDAFQLAENLKWDIGLGRTHNQLGWYDYLKGDLGLALDHYNNALVIWEKISDKHLAGEVMRGKSNAFRRIGGVYWAQGDNSTALDYFFKALKISEELGEKNNIASALSNIARVYTEQGDYTKALDYHRKALKMDEELGDENGIASDLVAIGIIYFAQGDYPGALDYYLKGFKIQEELDDKFGMASSLSEIGIVLREQGEYSKSLDYHFKALKIAEELGDKSGIVGCLGNIATTYNSQNDFDEAADYSTRALTIAKEIGDKNHIVKCLVLIGNGHSNKANYSEALDAYSRSLKISEEIGAKNEIALNLSNIGIVYTRTGKFKDAEEYLKKAIALNQSMRALNDLSRAEIAISNVYEATGRAQLALEHYRIAMQLIDTIYNEEREKQITQKVMQYEFEKKQQADSLQHASEIKINEIRMQKQRTYSFAGFAGAGMVAVFLFFVLKQRNKIAVLKREQQVRRRLASDLHDDVGSTLSSISYYSEAIRKQVNEHSPQVIPLLDKMEAASENTVDAMSDIVWATNPSFDKGTDLLNRMRSYAADVCDLKNVRLEFVADPSFENTRLNMETRRNVFLVFKEAVNNALKYSGCSVLKVSIDPGSIKIQDNGKGFDTLAEFPGNGLKNMQQRAREIKGRLEIQSSGDAGTLVVLKL